MASLDQAVRDDDQINQPDAHRRKVQESLRWRGDRHALATRDLRWMPAVMRANASANQSPTGGGQRDVRGPVGLRSRTPQLRRRVMADVRPARH